MEQINETKRMSHLKDATIDLTAGSLGGIALVYVGQPFDTIKVKMQTFPILYSNMFDCFRKTVQCDGFIRGLYAGTIPALAANVAENSVLFVGYGFCQKLMQTLTNTERIEHLSTLSLASSGFLAAFFSSLSLCPTELVKCKLQAMRETQGDNPKRIGPLQLTKDIFRAEGTRGLFKGLGSTMVREMPGYFFFFGGYEGTRLFLTPEGKTKDQIGLWKTMAAGAVGGIVFWLFIFPADVIKSRIQVEGKGNFISVTRKILRNEGMVAMYNGLVPTLCRTVPATATLFVVYEYSKQFMHYLF